MPDCWLIGIGGQLQGSAMVANHRDGIRMIAIPSTAHEILYDVRIYTDLREQILHYTILRAKYDPRSRPTDLKTAKVNSNIDNYLPQTGNPCVIAPPSDQV